MVYLFDACEFHTATRRLLVDGVAHALGGRAFDLLQVLVENHDRVVSKDEIFERVWPGLAVEPNNLQVQVWTLRKLLGHQVIATVARRGYRFMPAVQRLPIGPAVAPAFRHPPGVAATPAAAQALVARLAQDMAQQRLVTLVCADAAAGGRLLQTAAQLMSTGLAGRVWQLEAAALTGCLRPGPLPPAAAELQRAAGRLASERLHALLLRITRRPAMLVLLNGHRAEGLRGAVLQLLADAPRLRLVTCSPQALKLPGEKLLNWSAGEADPAPPAAAAGPGTEPHVLRWRSRA